MNQAEKDRLIKRSAKRINRFGLFITHIYNRIGLISFIRSTAHVAILEANHTILCGQITDESKASGKFKVGGYVHNTGSNSPYVDNQEKILGK